MLVEAQPSDLSSIHKEIAKVRDDLTSSLVAPITVLESTSLELQFDLFVMEDPVQSSYRKRPPMKRDETVERHVH